MHTAGVGAEAFTTAIETLWGVPAAGHGVSLAGKTDLQIGQEILTVLDLHDDHGDAGGRLPRPIAETERLVAASAASWSPPASPREEPSTPAAPTTSSMT